MERGPPADCVTGPAGGARGPRAFLEGKTDPGSLFIPGQAGRRLSLTGPPTGENWIFITESVFKQDGPGKRKSHLLLGGGSPGEDQPRERCGEEL